MSKGYPSLEEAQKIWEEGINHHLAKSYGFNYEGEYRDHTLGVAKAAERIASLIPDMDSNKAFILGLLHDHGKRVDEIIEQIFHGREGYEEMMRLGYPESAKICLTHTFPDKDFQDFEFKFPQDWIDWSRGKLKNIEYDDYDYLIIMCDKMFEAGRAMPMEKRIMHIVNRYKLPDNVRDLLLAQCVKLKNYFDKKIGKDVYDVLGIKE